jgi:Helix-loop-helix DNA-binding domain
MEGGDEVDINTNIIDASSTSMGKNNIDDRMAAPTDGVVVDNANAAVPADESKKSERKRKRERQRRSDLANAFEELSTLVIQIDPDDNDPQSTTLTNADGIAIPSSTISAPASIREHGALGASNKRVQRRKSSGEVESAAAQADLDGSGMTRLDLIGRTTMLLRRLQRENIDLRRRVDDYKKGRTSGSGSSGNNMMGMGGHNDDMVCLLSPTRVLLL